MSDDDWTPYGLEAFRQSRLWRRRLVTLLAVVVVALAWIGLSQFGGETTTTVDTFRGDGGSVTLQAPDKGGRPKPDATVTLTPGNLTAAPSAIRATGRQEVPPPDPGGPAPGAEPINFRLLAVQWGIPLALVLVGYLLAGIRGGSDHEVNYGIYKGAMPMETISARYSHLVETTRATYQDPFGKRREDYLPEDVAGPAGSGDVSEVEP